MSKVSLTDGPYIYHYRPTVGNTLSRRIIFWEGDPLALADITDDTFRMVVEYLDTGALVMDMTLGDGIEFADDNSIRWTIDAADTEDWEPPRPMRYAIVRTKANGQVRTIQAGNIIPQKFQNN